jgi:hypothetical protein
MKEACRLQSHISILTVIFTGIKSEYELAKLDINKKEIMKSIIRKLMYETFL